MKRIRDDGYVYVPAYNGFDDRTKSEKVLDSTAPIMFILFILLGCWIGTKHDAAALLASSAYTLRWKMGHYYRLADLADCLHRRISNTQKRTQE